MYHRFEAEVAGGLGPGIDYNGRRDPALIGPLHYEFAGWLGDDIVTTSGFWLVTGELAEALRASDLTGFEFAEVVVTKEAQFDMLPTPRPFPAVWERLVPTGTRDAGADLVLESRVDLLVSDAALALLQSFQITEAFTTSADEPPFQSDIMAAFLQQQRAKGNAV
ncbi:hypothetical protein [Agrococcus sp. ARC_14]|uniref:hypothetical protein n=1 Tax=Agrococcus sp. ARC_14 TaxID=2919927 RepID=UPI001F0659CC|nr:hypothetical protein [Agrococcus sp. ARC_14]MCH1881563.1 hypothetical protein [Agrococcus sp. ARC_14]